jgi:S-adenosylmethionine:tRNA ribosyltransferase-isomerase
MKPSGPHTEPPDSSAGAGDIPEAYRLSTYDYELPENLIAQEPPARRDESRLLLISRRTGAIRHHHFRDLPGLLNPSDLLIVNESRVVPALLKGRKTTGGRVELLVLDPARVPETAAASSEALRLCMVKSSKPVKEGAHIILDADIRLTVQESSGDGRARVSFPCTEETLISFLEEHGTPPLPPYIKSRDLLRDRNRYQTVYATCDGSVAAPTAGLHFTDELMSRLRTRGIQTATLVLHVGPGTFAPIRSEDIRRHRMETEHYEIPADTAAKIAQTKATGGRVIAVGTTCVRALESAVSPDGVLQVGRGSTDLFIMPGHSFNIVDGLVTNFHLPRSTLLVLISSFAGNDTIMEAYSESIKLEYRFYSYGDACLIAD